MIKKKKIIQNGCKTTEIKLGFLSLWKDVRTIFTRKLSILYIPVLFYKNKQWCTAKVFEDIGNYSNFLHNATKNKNKKVVLWIDHSLGGGTETYSFIQFEKFKDTCFFVRLQYYSQFSTYILSTFDTRTVYATQDFHILANHLNNINFSEIVVNNLVGYNNIPEILSFVETAKQKNNLKVSYRGHDYHSICPSFNLINCEGNYCNLSYHKGCQECLKKLVFSSDKAINGILKSSDDFIEWHNMWKNFFINALDEMIVFSDAVKDIFIQAYPELKNKTVIIPHTVKSLPPVAVPKHKHINIGVLGNIHVNKGSKIIREMCQTLPQNCSIFIIGKYKNPPKNLTVLGRYDVDNLPNIIVQNKIDIIFIPSIWPETFSYTTAEAMQMNMPVVCYNLGAPAERVKNYAKGLVLKEFSPKQNLQEILNFVNLLRKGE